MAATSHQRALTITSHTQTGPSVTFARLLHVPGLAGLSFQLISASSVISSASLL
jgi:hypothetical protein